MKFGKILFSFAMAASIGLGASVKADTLGFDARDITADGDPFGDSRTATVFTFATLSGGADTQLTLDNPTGIFAGIAPATIVASSTLNLAALGGTADPFLTLTLGNFSFIATTLANFGQIGDIRALEFTGLITGPPGFTPLAADFALSFTQAGGAGGTISYSGTLAVTAVPEPASVAMLAVGGLGLMGLALRQRRATR